MLEAGVLGAIGLGLILSGGTFFQGDLIRCDKDKLRPLRPSMTMSKNSFNMAYSSALVPSPSP